jgi:two-component system NarL family sensor kinase
MVAPAEVTFAPLLFGCIAFMLLAGSSVLGFFVTYQKRLLRQQLHLRNTELTYQQHLLTAVIEAQETERERIGRDLHDDIGSTISTAKLLLNRLAGRTRSIWLGGGSAGLSRRV